jgi:hypothetical protein
MRGLARPRYRQIAPIRARWACGNGKAFPSAYRIDGERDVGLAHGTDPPREVRRDFRDDVRVSVDRAEFEQLRRAV